MVEHTKVRRVMFQALSLLHYFPSVIDCRRGEEQEQSPVDCRGKSNRRRGETNSFALYIQGHVELNPVRHLLSFRKG